MLPLVPGPWPAGHLKKRLPSRGSELAANKRLRALAGLALKRNADSEDEEEAEMEAELALDDELAAGELAPRATGSTRRGVRSARYASDAGSDGEEDEGEEDEELVLRSLHRSKLARTGSGAASPHTASLAPPLRAQPDGGGRRAGGSGSAGRRHVTRAATGSLRPRHFDELEGQYGSDEEQYDAVLDAEERYLLQVGGSWWRPAAQPLAARDGRASACLLRWWLPLSDWLLQGSRAAAPRINASRQPLLQARQTARGGSAGGAARLGAPGGGRTGSRDSSQHTRSTTEHCSEQEPALGTAAAAAAAVAAAPPFFRSLSSSGSTGKEGQQVAHQVCAPSGGLPEGASSEPRTLVLGGYSGPLPCQHPRATAHREPPASPPLPPLPCPQATPCLIPPCSPA